MFSTFSTSASQPPSQLKARNPLSPPTRIPRPPSKYPASHTSPQVNPPEENNNKQPPNNRFQTTKPRPTRGSAVHSAGQCTLSAGGSCPPPLLLCVGEHDLDPYHQTSHMPSLNLHEIPRTGSELVSPRGDAHHQDPKHEAFHLPPLKVNAVPRVDSDIVSPRGGHDADPFHETAHMPALNLHGVPRTDSELASPRGEDKHGSPVPDLRLGAVPRVDSDIVSPRGAHAEDPYHETSHMPALNLHTGPLSLRARPCPLRPRYRGRGCRSGLLGG